MKSISIKGKNNIDKINHIDKHSKINNEEGKNEKAIRLGMEEIIDVDILHKKQIEMINKFFIGEDFEYKKMIEREIEKKIQGYKQQDIKKNIYNENLIIKLDDVIEKLLISKLKCYYCYKEIFVIYKNVRDNMQWTLDRKDNDLCHSKDNTLISCLKCNLQRRVTDVDKFTFTKHLRITKTYD
jgi:hypothetical protein